VVSTVARHRRLKVRAGTLGWFLCWAVVFADIGTSIYYVPGILYGPYGTRSGIFVLMTLVAFVLLSVKYTEVTWRFPEGGGVVNVSARALHPFVGLLGGFFILVDYYLTAALSALSGLIYLSVVAPPLAPSVLELAVVALVGLAVLNLLGIRDSARVTAIVACLAAAGQLLVVAATALFLGPSGIVHSFQALGRGPHLTGLLALQGFAGAFLAFSGLETIAQLAPGMREPRRRIAAQAMGVVVMTMAITSPLLTIWSTALLDGRADPNQFISLLGAHVAGQMVGAYVAVTGALLLVFASNTAVIGAYHVFLALSRMGFLPRSLQRRNQWRRTPHWAILLAIAVPVAVLVVTRGDVTLLGDLYAFGLLGAFILTCLSLDVIRLHEWTGGWTAGRMLAFSLGVVTTVLVTVAWVTNLINKPLATAFGGGLTVVGLVVGLTTYARRRPVVFPFMHRPNVPVTPISMARRMRPARVLAVLPDDLRSAEAVVTTALQTCGDDPVVFLYRGAPPPARTPELMEVADPFLSDRRAQSAFAQAERAARRSVRDRQYVYVPGNLSREVVGDVWKAVHPRDTVLAEGDQDVLPPVALDRVRRRHVDGLPVLHLVSGRRPAGVAGASER